MKISQHEVLELLKQNKGKRFTSREIAKTLGSAETTICKNLKCLRQNNWIKYQPGEMNNRSEFGKFWRYWVE